MKTQGKSQDRPRFTGRSAEVDALGVVSDFSEDGQAGTIVFSNLRVDLEGERGPFVTTRTVSISIPVENNGYPLKAGHHPTSTT